MTLDRRGLEIGPIDLFGLTINPTFHWYGLIIVSGILVAASLVAWMAKRDDKDPEHVWNGVIWVITLAVVGARLWHIFFPSISSVEDGRTAHWYLTHPFDLHDGPFIVWSGGLSVFGAVIGGALGILLYARKHHLDILAWLDIAAVAVPLGQGIGRWGNFVNEELYGKPTNLPWGIHIDNPPPEYAQYSKFHPLFLYESLWNLLAFGLLFYLWWRFRERLKKGDFVLLYMVLYPTARFFLEFLRIEVTTASGINVSQAFSAVVALLSIALLLYRHRDDLFNRRTSAQKKTHRHST
jgi:phosphatidylglycerol:prolipoprotein diacylglycerol transferase